MTLRSPRIAVVGSANFDYTMHVPALPRRGETITGGAFKRTYGGKGANQAIAAARAGSQVTLVGALGDDPASMSYAAHLSAEGIDCSHLHPIRDTASGSALILFDDHGDNCIAVSPGANSHLTPERIEGAEPLLRASDWIILQQEVPVETNQAVLALAASSGNKVLLNYAPGRNYGLCLDATVTLLVVNEVEAAEVAGESFSPDDMYAAQAFAKRLQQTGAHDAVIITLGEHGLAMADAAAATHRPAFAVNPVDSTAAGDTFCGALATALGEGQDLPLAVRFASAAAALCVGRVGAQEAIPQRAEVEQFLAVQSD